MNHADILQMDSNLSYGHGFGHVCLMQALLAKFSVEYATNVFYRTLPAVC